MRLLFSPSQWRRRPAAAAAPAPAPVASAPAPRRQEQRSAARHRVAEDAPVACRLVAGGGPGSQSAVVRDVSTTGVGLVLSGPVDPGVMGLLSVTDRPSRPSRLLMVSVVHATVLPDGGYLVGCQFTQPLTPDDVWGLFLREAN